jgi:hypothetical protein
MATVSSTPERAIFLPPYGENRAEHGLLAAYPATLPRIFFAYGIIAWVCNLSTWAKNTLTTQFEMGKNCRQLTDYNRHIKAAMVLS